MNVVYLFVGERVGSHEVEYRVSIYPCFPL